MKEYLITNRPKISLLMILILFVSAFLTLIFNKMDGFIMLYPSNLSEPLNWYRLLTYPLAVGGLIIWFKTSIVFVLTGYIIEHRVKKFDMLGMIILSSIIGGLFFIILNQNNELNIPIASPVMISWGYWAAAIVIGVKRWRSLNLFEKVIIILCGLSILSIWNDNLGFLIGQLMVIVIVFLIAILKIK